MFEISASFRPGRHAFTWFPPPTTSPRTYLTLLEVEDAAGNRRSYGAGNAESGRKLEHAGDSRARSRRRIHPRELRPRRGGQACASRRTHTTFSLQMFRAGPEDVPTYNDTLMNGVPVTEPVHVAWSSLDRPATISVPVGAWPSGVYFAKLTATTDASASRRSSSGLRSSAHQSRGDHPHNTWQAYNFRDQNGNGWGDTWYAKGAQSTVRLGRAFLRRGVPPQYRKYDLGFLRWLAQHGKQPDYLTETDLEVLESGDTLARLYDLVIYGGHTEYVTTKEMDLVQRYRDLGGNLIFLSANNFFWNVRRQGTLLTRTRKWRELGRPESALIGVQYRANDDGRIQHPFVVRAADTVPWLFAGTGLSNGAVFGQELGGYGIEIDATTPASPPGTTVLAEIPDLFGPGFTAQMTYYETPAGARVFAAGAIDFGGTALLPAVSRMLENLWARLSVP